MNKTINGSIKKPASIFLLVMLTVCCFAQNAKPNIILFLVDDMGVMDTSVPFLVDANGNPKKYALNDWYRTPNMERLVKSGIRFSTFYAQSVCSPSRISILTGQNSARHRTTQWINPEINNKGEFGPKNWQWQGITKSNRNTLPKLLQAEGYKTIFVGKAHLGSINSDGENPENIGFDYNIAGTAWGSPGSYLGTDNYKSKRKNKRNQVPNLEKYHGTNTFLTEALTLEASLKIADMAKEKTPFFLEMSHYAVHAPFTFDDRFKNHYQSDTLSVAAKKFATMIAGMDKSLGDIMDQLNTLGIAENTLILFVGDNGSDAYIGDSHKVGSSAPLRGKKGTHYEGGMRVPFIASWAKPDGANANQKAMPIERGSIQTQMGSIMDIYPTILDLLNIEIPKNYVIDGNSLRLNFEGKSNPKKTGAFLMHFPHAHRSSYFTSYRNGDWKLIYHYHPDLNTAKVTYELFNLAKDPSEAFNLYKAHPKKLNQMVSVMHEKLEDQKALYPIDTSGKILKPLKTE